MKWTAGVLLLVAFGAVTSSRCDAKDWQAIDVDAALICGQILYDHGLNLDEVVDAHDQFISFVEQKYPSYQPQLQAILEEHQDEDERYFAYSWFLSKIRAERLPDALLTLSRSQFKRDNAAAATPGELAAAEDRYLDNLKAVTRHFNSEFTTRLALASPADEDATSLADEDATSPAIRLSDAVYLEAQLEWLSLFGEKYDRVDRMADFLELFRESPVRLTVLNWYAAAQRRRAIALHNSGQYDRAKAIYLDVLSRFPDSAFETIFREELCTVLHQKELAFLAAKVPRLVERVPEDAEPQAEIESPALALRMTYANLSDKDPTDAEYFDVERRRIALSERIDELRLGVITQQGLAEAAETERNRSSHVAAGLRARHELRCLVAITNSGETIGKSLKIYLPKKNAGVDVLDQSLDSVVDDEAFKAVIVKLEKSIVNSINNAADQISKSIQDQTGELASSLAAIKNEITAMSNALQAELQGVRDAVDGVQSQLTTLNATAVAIRNEVGQLNETARDILDESKRTNSQLEDLNDKADKIIEVSEEILDTTKQVVQEVQGLRSELRKSRRRRGRLGLGSIPGIGHVQNIASNARKQSTRQLNALKEQAEAAGDAIADGVEQAIKELEKAPEAARRAIAKLIDLIDPEITVFDFTVDVRGSGYLAGLSTLELIGPGGIKLNIDDLKRISNANLKSFADIIEPASLSFFLKIGVTDEYQAVKNELHQAHAGATGVYVVSRRTVDALGPEELLQDIVFLVLTGDANSLLNKYQELFQFEWKSFTAWVRQIGKEGEALQREAALAFVLAIADAVSRSVGEELTDQFEFSTGALKVEVSKVKYTYNVAASGSIQMPFDLLDRTINRLGVKSRLRLPKGRFEIDHYCPTVAIYLPQADVQALEQLDAHFPSVTVPPSFQPEHVEKDVREYLGRLQKRASGDYQDKVANWVEAEIMEKLDSLLTEALPEELVSVLDEFDAALTQLGHDTGLVGLLLNPPRYELDAEGAGSAIAGALEVRIRKILLDRLLDRVNSNDLQAKSELLQHLYNSNYSVNLETLEILGASNVIAELREIIAQAAGSLSLRNLNVDIRTGSYTIDASIRFRHKWKLSDAPAEAKRIFESFNSIL